MLKNSTTAAKWHQQGHKTKNTTEENPPSAKVQISINYEKIFKQGNKNAEVAN